MGTAHCVEVESLQEKHVKTHEALTWCSADARVKLMAVDAGDGDGASVHTQLLVHAVDAHLQSEAAKQSKTRQGKARQGRARQGKESL